MCSFSILRRVPLLQWTTIFIGILLIASQGIYLSFVNALGAPPPSIIEVRGMNYKGSIILYWKNADQISTTSLANDYIVQYKKSTDSAYSVYTDGVSTNTYATLTGFEKGFIYDFRILPKNDSGNGSVSNLIEIPYTPDASTVSPTIYSSLQQSIDVPIATIQNPNTTSPSLSVSPGSTPSGGAKTSFDTTPPTAPTNLAITNRTESTLSLSWSPSTDNVGVAGYRIYRNKTPLYITNAGVTKYTDTNLKDGTKYTYSITAFDAKSNTSLPSATLTGETLKKTSDTSPPTAPTAPKFLNSTDSSTSFSWAPSKDNIGVAGYRIYRNDTFITTMTGLTYTDTGLLSSTSYTYTVVALDAAGNYSTPSPKITIRTLQKIRDTVPPSVPKNLSASNIITNAVTLTWSSSTDNIGVTGYNVYRKGVLLTTITDTTYTDSSLTPDTAYSYFIRASDAAGNLSIQTNTINITTKPVQTPGPTPTPLNDISSVAVSSITQVGATITWVTGSPSDSSIEYGLTTTYGSKTPVDTKPLTSHSIALTGLSSGKTYHYRVLSKDSIGRVSASPDATFSTPNSTPSQDSIPPSVPTTLTTSNITSTNVTLTWSASTDNVSVAGYNIYRNGASIATSTTSLYSDSNLTPSTTYSYAVSAYDSAGNTSALTSLVRATTQKGGTPGNYTLGWNELFSTKLKDVCPPDGQKDWNGNKYLFSYACRNVITAWSSGIFDSLRNRFILWGGGHGDYFGNELYAVNLGQIPPNLVRLNDPSPINTDLNDCKETLSDGNPNSRHTYGGLVYIQHADRMFTYGGSLACGGGNTSFGTWTLDMSNLKWKRMDPVNGVKGTIPGSFYANPPVTADYDINTKLVFVTDNHELWSYNYDTNTYVLLNQGMNLPTNSYGVIDPKRKLFIFMGSPYLKEGTPKVEAISLASGSTYQLQDWSSEVKGCDAIAGADYPGLTYDSAIDRIVGWPGLGNSVYIFNPDTKTCMIQTFTNGPANPQDAGGNPVPFVNNGTLARFKYIPSMDAILAINSWINNAYILKISTGSNLPAQDTTAPTVPSGFTGKIISSTQANLAWSASTDNVSVAGYNIYRNGVQVATVNTPSYSDNSLSSNTSYSYAISAYDAAGNTSAQTSSVTVTTQAQVIVPSAGNSITLTNKGNPISNYPVQLGRPFVQGEIPSGNQAQVTLDGKTLPTQVDVKSRWSDGSLKHAVISFIIPTFSSNQTITATFGKGNTVGNTPLTQTQLLDPLYDFNAQIKLTKGGVTKIADARLMLTGGNYTVWASGPLSTTIILADHSQGILCGGKAGSKYDLGFDNYCPFRPEFIATFWPSTHQVEVRYVGELANTEQQEDLLVDSMVLTIGNTSPSNVYMRTTPLNMLAASRWTKQYWLGGIPSPISINPNIGYLSATKFLPNYDTSKVIPQSALTANALAWKSGNKDLYDDAGEMKKGMATAGDQPQIGPYPTWTTMWLYSADKDAQDKAFGIADLSAAWPMHYREGDAKRYFDRAKTVSGLGHPVSITDRKTICLICGINYHYTLPFDRIVQVGTITEQAYGGWVPDAAHQPDMFSPQYTVTGDPFYLEEMQFWASYSAAYFNGAAGTTPCGRGPTGAEGVISGNASGCGQIRGQAWVLRNRAQTAFMTPDSMPEKDYFTMLINDTIAAWEGARDITGSQFQGNALWKWGNTIGKQDWGTVGIPALHFWEQGGVPLAVQEPSDPKMTSKAISPWEQNFLMYALGRTKELGYPTDALINWFAPNLIGQLTDPGYNPYLAGAYRLPTQSIQGGYFSTWSQVKTGFLTGAQNAINFDSPSTFNNILGSPSGGYPYFALGAASFVTDQTNGKNAWSFVEKNILSSTYLNNDPKWALIPR